MRRKRALSSLALINVSQPYFLEKGLTGIRPRSAQERIDGWRPRAISLFYPSVAPTRLPGSHFYRAALLPRLKHHATANHRQGRMNVLDVGGRHRHVIAVEHDEVGLLPDFEGAECLLLKE